MDRITDYMLLTSDDSDILGLAALDSIQLGWQPLGGVACSLSESDEYKYPLFAQAMVKYAENEEVRSAELATGLQKWEELHLMVGKDSGTIRTTPGNVGITSVGSAKGVVGKIDESGLVTVRFGD